MSNTILTRLANSRLVIMHSMDLSHVPGATFISQLYATNYHVLTLAQVLAIASLPQGSNGMTVEEILARDAINARAVAQQICEPLCTTNLPGVLLGAVPERMAQIIAELYGPAIP